MDDVELTAYLPANLIFSRGETPAFRLTFTGVTALEVAEWELSAAIRRAPMLEPIAEWDVAVDGTSVTFSLDDDVTETLPDRASYKVRIGYGENTVRYPMGGRLLLRQTEVC